MPATRVRSPAVAGAFYPRDPVALRHALESSFAAPRGPGQDPANASPTRKERRILAGIVPHAGYIYSGPIAAHFFARLAAEPRPAAVVLLGVNHQGAEGLLSLSDEDWRTPLGVVPTDRELMRSLAKPPIAIDGLAHHREHSLEVELPFLQYLWPDPPPIVALQVTFTELSLLKEAGEVVARALHGRDVLLIASTDFSHYLPVSEARRLDDLAIEAVLSGSPDRLYRTVMDQDISMCGIAPTTVLLSALQGTGLRPQLLAKGSSADAEPMDTVVGYASFVVER